MFRLSVCFAVLVCVFWLGAPAHGQTVTATLQGQVLDASGGGVPKAKVSAVNTETAFSRSTESDSSGEYSLPAMPPGRLFSHVAVRSSLIAGAILLVVFAVALKTAGLLAMMEPLMIVFLGIVVGGMVVAMYLPIFDMVNAVQ